MPGRLLEIPWNQACESWPPSRHRRCDRRHLPTVCPGQYGDGLRRAEKLYAGFETAHRTEPSCAGCHKLMDPIGLGLRELWNSVGAERATENDAKIDPGGALDGANFADSSGLGKAIHRSSSHLGLSGQPALCLWRRPRADQGRSRAGSRMILKRASPRMAIARDPADAPDRAQRRLLPYTPSPRRNAGAVRIDCAVGRAGGNAMSVVSMKADRRTALRGLLGGAAVSVALPFLNCLLNANGDALAATGQKLPNRFGTWFWGCGLTPGALGAPSGRARSGRNLAAAQTPRPLSRPFHGVQRAQDLSERQCAGAAHMEGARRPDWRDRQGARPPASTRWWPTPSAQPRDSARSRWTCAGLRRPDPEPAQHQRHQQLGNLASGAPTCRLFGPEFRDPNAAEFQARPQGDGAQERSVGHQGGSRPA